MINCGMSIDNLKLFTIIFIVLILSLTTVFSNVLYADQISRVKGDRFTGKIVRMDKGILVCKVYYASRNNHSVE
jgi:hypothetical protein